MWNWLPAKGHLGGIIVGIRDDLKEVEDWFVGEYLIEATIRDRQSNFRWILIVVYGPAQHEQSTDFLSELSARLDNHTLPIIVGGDFNLIRENEDKSSLNGDARLMGAFNAFIEHFELRELKKSDSNLPGLINRRTLL